jgi:hypothetical protein
MMIADVSEISTFSIFVLRRSEPRRPLREMHDSGDLRFQFQDVARQISRQRDTGRRQFNYHSGAVLGAARGDGAPFALRHPAARTANRKRSPMVRGDHGSESIDDSPVKPSQTGHSRLN